MEIYYKISSEFTIAPGPREIKEGPYSGELFLNEILLPKFKETVKKNGVLIIDLDGTFGYPPSFLDEAFGGLVKETQMTKNEIFKHLVIKSSRKHYIDTINTRMTVWEELYLK